MAYLMSILNDRNPNICFMSYIGDRFQYDIHDICQKIMKFQNLEKSNEPIRK